jgi:hypothetical protein
MPADKWQNIDTVGIASMVLLICSTVAVTGDDSQGLTLNGGRI